MLGISNAFITARLRGKVLSVLFLVIVRKTCTSAKSTLELLSWIFYCWLLNISSKMYCRHLKVGMYRLGAIHSILRCSVFPLIFIVPMELKNLEVILNSPSLPSFSPSLPEGSFWNINYIPPQDSFLAPLWSQNKVQIHRPEFKAFSFFSAWTKC